MLCSNTSGSCRDVGGRVNIDLGKLASLRRQGELDRQQAERDRQQSARESEQQSRERELQQILSKLPKELEERARSGATSYVVYCTRNGSPLGVSQSGDKWIYSKLKDACKAAGLSVHTKWSLEWGCRDLVVEL
jgi:hypothetical protein